MNPPTLETTVSSLLPPPPSTVCSLSAAVSEISSLIGRSTSILHSLPISYEEANTQGLLPCPFNPNHRIPPSLLFSHYLNCPSPVSLAHSFRYKDFTLHSLPAPSTFFVPNDSSQVSVSLEPYNRYAVSQVSESFYEGCPGPVTPSFLPPPFNLPVVLAKECRDFAGERNSEMPTEAYSIEFIRFLPSEIWAIQNELEAWQGNLPVEYSLRILRAILNFRHCNLPLKQWVVSGSARYRMPIDSALGDHIVLLIRLCFKVMTGEAFRCNEEYKMEKKDDFLASKFPFPMLVEVMKWLSMQLSILYGAAQANTFAVELLNECILESSVRASLFPLEQEKSEPNDTESIVSTEGEAVWIDTIFLAQVAAAIAALQERSMVEEKIRYSRCSHMQTPYQRNVEHAHLAHFANEERLKRVDYKPVIEHDAFFGQSSSNQETNKMKTKEELLAEERDYKRRRISYRGKKQKRSTVEVMRDIIEEYMEELKKTRAMQGIMDALSENPDVADAPPTVKKSKEVRYDPSRGQQLVDSTTDSERMRHDRGASAESQDPKHHNKSTKHSQDLRNQDPGGHSTWRSHDIREPKKRRDIDEHDYKNWRKEEAVNSHRKQRYADTHERRYREEGVTVRDPERRDKDYGSFGDRRVRKGKVKSSDEFEDRYDPMESHSNYEDGF